MSTDHCRIRRHRRSRLVIISFFFLSRVTRTAPAKTWRRGGYPRRPPYNDDDDDATASRRRLRHGHLALPLSGILTWRLRNHTFVYTRFGWAVRIRERTRACVFVSARVCCACVCPDSHQPRLSVAARCPTACRSLSWSVFTFHETPFLTAEHHPAKIRQRNYEGTQKFRVNSYPPPSLLSMILLLLPLLLLLLAASLFHTV